MCVSYFQTWSGRSALVHYPTGSGKTGIMAVIAALRAVSGPVLIVCPSDALVDQLISELQSDFWDTIGADQNWHLPNTVRLYPSTVDAIMRQTNENQVGRQVVVGTIQALQQIHTSSTYQRLIGLFSIVMFDEGHREPAPKWASAVRGLNAPIVLFSATPYRNDYKLFAVDPGFITFLSFQKASFDGLIRPVSVIEEELPNSAVGFAQFVIGWRDKMIRDNRMSASDKIIVRADTEQLVQDIFAALKSALVGRAERVLAIHDNFHEFEDNGDFQFRNVPNGLRQRTETFLVHQFKLIEGIDDPSCRLLALFDPFGTDRQLVQQIGRLTRHPGPIGQQADPAFVLARRGDEAQKAWARFLEYDQSCVDNNDIPPIRGPDVLQKLIDALPESEYVGGKFRVRADFNVPSLADEIRVPLSAVLFEIEDTFELSEFSKDVDQALDAEDREVAYSGITNTGRCFFRISFRLNQTPHLDPSLFQTASLELTVVAKIHTRIFFYDSAGLSVENHPNLIRRISPRLLSTLLPESSATSVTSLTLRNMDLNPLALRGRSMRARDLDTAGIFMGEHSHVAVRTTGYKSQSRRALTLSRGRVREAEGVYHSLDQFENWCSGIADELNRAPDAARLFTRFASEIPPPSEIVPKNILMDLYDFAGMFVDREGQNIEFDFEGVCVDIRTVEDGPAGYPFAFDLTINRETIPVYLRYDQKKNKYWIKAFSLSNIKDQHNDKKTLAARINQYQPFRIIIDSKTVYAYGKFYSIELDLQKQNGPGATVLGMLTDVSGLSAVKSEKGNLRDRSDTWPGDSLFGFIDSKISDDMSEFGPKFSALVCDDLGTESGDFIGIDEAPPGRISFIAAKWKDGEAGAGASPLYDVVAQTLKNLGYLKSDGEALPGNSRKFDNDWRFRGGRVPRRRYGPGSLTFRRKFEEIRARPSTRREAWLVLGGGLLSKRAVAAGFSREEPEAHVLQLFHLLLSLYSTCQAVGVEPKIFCAK